MDKQILFDGYNLQVTGQISRTLTSQRVDVPNIPILFEKRKQHRRSLRPTGARPKVLNKDGKYYNTERWKMTTTKALKILDMFLDKQCNLSRTERFYDEGMVWDAVLMARDALENKRPDPSEEKERIIESLRDAIEMLEEKERTEQDVREAYNIGFAFGCEQKKVVDRYTSGEE